MKNEITKIIETFLEKEEKSLEEFKGGMDKYLETLEDSDSFYNEASTMGAVNVLKRILELVNIETSEEIINRVKMCIEANTDLIVKESVKTLFHLFEKENVKFEFEGMEDGKYLENYYVHHKNKKFFLSIEDKKFVRLDVETENGWEQLLFVEDEQQSCFIKYVDYKILVTVPNCVLNEYYNEIISDISYNSKADGSGEGQIIIEGDKYGFGLDGFKFNYTWKVASFDYINIGGETFEISGATNLELSRIYVYTFKCPEDITSFTNYCKGSGISIDTVKNVSVTEKTKFHLITMQRYVAKEKGKYFIASNKEGIGAVPLKVLPSGFEIDFLNRLCNQFKDKLQINFFENNVAEFEKEKVLLLKEGEDDQYATSYIVSNLIPDWQLQHCYKLATFVWDEGEDGMISFEDIAEKVNAEFGDDLNVILEGDIPSSWTEILNAIFNQFKIEYRIIENQTFVI